MHPLTLSPTLQIGCTPSSPSIFLLYSLHTFPLRSVFKCLTNLTVLQLGHVAILKHDPTTFHDSVTLSLEDQPRLSQELAALENPSREDQTQEPAARDMDDTTSDNTKDQSLDKIDSTSEEQLPMSKGPLVTILPREDALLNSQKAALLQPQEPLSEWSFWTDACLRGPKPAKLEGCGFCVVHRRLDNSHPTDQDFAIKWWESCFVARNVNQIGHAEMIAVAQALEMAVDQCERISGTVVTKARIKMPGKAEEIKSQAAAIPWPMPKLVSVFTDSQQVLSSIDSSWRYGRWPGNRSPMRRANEMIEALGDLGVRVHLQWVPGHSGDLRNRWAHEGARRALKPQHHGRKTFTKKLHRVCRRCHKDRPRKKAKGLARDEVEPPALQRNNHQPREAEDLKDSPEGGTESHLSCRSRPE